LGENDWNALNHGVFNDHMQLLRQAWLAQLTSLHYITFWLDVREMYAKQDALKVGRQLATYFYDRVFSEKYVLQQGVDNGS
jgi:hypothetical protein